jgi:hypothetical protein
MIREAIGVAMLSMVALIALAIFLSNRRLRAKQEIQIPVPTKFEAGELVAACFYVSTCFRSDPLKRVWAHGFGHRGQVELVLNDNQLGFNRKGEPSFGIPLMDMTFIGTATATIDKGVEANGLIAIHWNLGATPVITNLRIVNPEVRRETLKKLAGLIGAVDA